MNPLRSLLVALAFVAVAASGAALAQPRPGGPSTSPTPPGTAGSATADALSATLHRSTDAQPIRAALLGVWIDDEEVLTEAAGTSMTGVPATTDMHVRTGSITISLLVTLLMRAVDRGDVALDDPLAAWFPDLPFAEEVTLAMLARSTSGYADYVYTDAFLEALRDDPFRQWRPQELIRLGIDAGHLFEPGTDFHYAHTNFVLLEEVMTAATGLTMDALIRRDVLEPLDLDDTSYPLATDGSGTLVPEMPFPVLHAFSMDRGIYEDATYWNPSWVSFYGGLNSTLDDLGRWTRALGTGELLSDASYDAMTAPASVGFAGMTPTAYYGAGVGVRDGWIVQNPSFDGYQAVIGHHPPSGTSIVIVATLAEDYVEGTHYAQLVFQELVADLERGE